MTHFTSLTLTTSHYLVHFQNMVTHAQKAVDLLLTNSFSTYLLHIKLKEPEFSF